MSKPESWHAQCSYGDGCEQEGPRSLPTTHGVRCAHELTLLTKSANANCSLWEKATWSASTPLNCCAYCLRKEMTVSLPALEARDWAACACSAAAARPVARLTLDVVVKGNVVLVQHLQ